MSDKQIVETASQIEMDEKERLAIKRAQIYTNNVKTAALSINDIHMNKTEIKTLADNLQKQVDEVLSGDVNNVESMLMTQAQTLNAIFHRMITKMAADDYYPSIEMYSNIALRAQNQCRQTLAVLGDLKRPQQKTVVQQQNLAINQQVNNSLQAVDAGVAKPANELLGVPYEPMDSRETIAPIKINSQLEAVEKICGSENRARKGEKQDERL